MNQRPPLRDSVRMLAALALVSLAFACVRRNVPKPVVIPVEELATEEEFEAPTEFKEFQNAISIDDRQCVGLGKCDQYELQWPPGTSVQVELETSEFASELTLSCDEESKVAKGGPGAPAVVQVVLDHKGSCRIQAAARTSGAVGAYTLRVGPSPAVEAKIPRPPPTEEESLRLLLSGTEPVASLKMSNADRDRALTKASKGFVRYGTTQSASLEDWEAVPMKLEPGYCYHVVWRLQKGAQLSELAKRGLEYSLRYNKRDHVQPAFVLGNAGVSDAGCLNEPREVAFDLAASLGPRKLRHALGKGTVSIQVERAVRWPGLASTADLQKEVAAATRGRSLKQKQKVSLEGPVSVPLPLGKGSCYAAVLRLSPGAQWSSAVAQHGGNVSFRFADGDETSGGVRGPGLVGTAGCAAGEDPATLEISGYGDDQALGTGSATLELWARPARAAELAADARKRQSQSEQAGK